MRTPHTHYTKGKTVWVRLKNGKEFIGKFKERKGRFIRLENHEFLTSEISAMNYRKHKHKHKHENI